MTFMCTNITFLLILVRINYLLNTYYRIAAGFTLSCLVFIVAAWMPSTSIDPVSYFKITLGLIVLSSLSSSLLIGVFGFVANYSPHLLSFVTSGQGMGGILPSVVQLLILYYHSSGFGVVSGYFAVSIVAAIGCLIGLVSLNRIDRPRTSHLHVSESIESIAVTPSEQTTPVPILPRPMEPPTSSFAVGFDQLLDEIRPLEEEAEQQIRQRTISQATQLTDPLMANLTTFEEDSHLLQDQPERYDGISEVIESPTEPEIMRELSVGEILSILKIHTFSTYCNFFVVLAIFPAITSAVQSVQIDQSNVFRELFTPLHFFFFNTFDWLGKSLPMLGFGRPKKPIYLMIRAIAHLGFIPIFLSCNVVFKDTDGTPLPRVLPLVFGDFMFYLWICLFGLSSGYLNTCLFIEAPTVMQRYSHPKIKSVVGDLMGVSLALGLATGSLFSFIIRASLCNCNPFKCL